MAVYITVGRLCTPPDEYILVQSEDQLAACEVAYRFEADAVFPGAYLTHGQPVLKRAVEAWNALVFANDATPKRAGKVLYL